MLLLCLLVSTSALRLAVVEEPSLEFEKKPTSPCPVCDSDRLDDPKFTFGDNCQNSEHPKIAFCVVGDARTFAERETVTRFMNNAILPAKQAGATGITREDPDIFVDVHTEKNDTEAIQQSIDFIKATKSVLVEGMGGADRKILDLGCWPEIMKRHKPIEWLMNYYKSIYGCYTMMRDAEEKANKKYDMIILNRPDHQWCDEHGPEYDELRSQYNGNGPVVTFGGAPVSKSIQCKKSILKRDYYGFHTRTGFEDFGTIYRDHFPAKEKEENGKMCGSIHKFEHVPQWYVTQANKKNPGSVLFSNGHANGFRLYGDGP